MLVPVRRAPERANHPTGHRVQFAQQRCTVPGQDPTHGRRGQAQPAADEHRTAVGQGPHDPHPRFHARRSAMRMRTCHAGPVDQACPPELFEPPPPPPCGRAGHAHLSRDVRDRTARRDPTNHDQPASWSQPGVSVRQERPPCTRARNLDSSNSTPEVSPTSTTIRVSTTRRAVPPAGACARGAARWISRAARAGRRRPDRGAARRGCRWSAHRPGPPRARPAPRRRRASPRGARTARPARPPRRRAR